MPFPESARCQYLPAITPEFLISVRCFGLALSCCTGGWCDTVLQVIEGGSGKASLVAHPDRTYR